MKIKIFNGMDRLTALLLALLLCLPVLFSSPVEAGRRVSVAFYENGSFQRGSSPTGARSGYAYEYLQKLAGLTGWEYDYVYGSFDELYPQFAAGQIDLLCGLARDQVRGRGLCFPELPMGREYYGLYCLKQSVDAVWETGSLNGLRVGCTPGPMSEALRTYLDKNGLQAEIVLYPGQKQLLQELLAGNLQAIVAETNLLASNSQLNLVTRIAPIDFYAVLAPGREELLAELNAAQSRLQIENPTFTHHLSKKYFSSSLHSSSLSPTELEWLKKHPVLRVGYADNYLPYSTSIKGQATGLVTDLTHHLVELALPGKEPELQFRAYPGIIELVQGLQRGEIDVAFPLYENPYRAEKDNMLLSEVVLDTPVYYIYKDKLNGQRFAVPDSLSLQAGYVKARFPRAELITCQRVEDCLDAVLNDKADCTLLEGLRYSSLLEHSAYRQLKKTQIFQTNRLVFGVRRNDTDLLSLLNRGILMLDESFVVSRAYYYESSLRSRTLEDYLRDHLWLTCLGALLLLGLMGATAVFYARSGRLQRERSQELAVQLEENAALTRRLQDSVEKEQQLNLELKALNNELAGKEQLLRRAKAAAEKASGAKTSFLFNMSHDIRTPMNAILGFTQLLRQHADQPDRVLEYVGKINASGNFLLTLINNVLDVARIESGKTTLDETVFDARKMVRELVAVFEARVREKNFQTSLQVNITHNIIISDELKVKQIMLNLISNAFKYTPEGGRVDTVLEELPDSREGWCRYRAIIKDSGIGMSEEFLPRLFEEFSREHSTTDSRVQGTGLGMPIVKQLVQLLDGTIEVTSKLGEGTTVTVELPHRIASEADLQAVVTPTGELNPERFAGRRILLAEDNELNAEIATELLTSAGFSVEHAEDGVVCVHMLEQAAPGYYDLILMDIQMPNMDGYKATGIIRSLPDAAKASIPIAAMTANAFEEDKRMALKSGMNAHIAKPIDMDVLLQTLAELL